MRFLRYGMGCGDGHSERLLGEALKRHRDSGSYIATKIPPKNRKSPAGPSTAWTRFPTRSHPQIRREEPANIGVDTLDLQQLHVSSDAWAEDDKWQKAVSKLKEEKLVRAIGISVDRFQPRNVLGPSRPASWTRCRSSTTRWIRIQRTNCSRRARLGDVTVIARVPFDEGRDRHANG